MASTMTPVMMSEKIYEEIEQSIQKSYPNSCILYIDRITNTLLEDKYQTRKNDIEKTRGVVKEARLFHGTKHTNIQCIIDEGFKSNANVRSAYGIGTYFSTTASYSKEYMDSDLNSVSYMFVCDVLIGNITTVYGPRPINTDQYDNSVNGNIYVTPYDDGCIPRYLVAFHKNAH